MCFFTVHRLMIMYLQLNVSIFHNIYSTDTMCATDFVKILDNFERSVN